MPLLADEVFQEAKPDFTDGESDPPADKKQQPSTAQKVKATDYFRVVNPDPETFLGSFAKAAVEPFKAMAKAPSMVTMDDDSWYEEIQKESVHRRSAGKSGLGATVGRIAGSVAGGVGEFTGATIAASETGAAAPFVGPAVAFGASGSWESALNAGVRAYDQGLPKDKVVSIAKKMAGVGAATGAATAVALGATGLIPRTATALARTGATAAIGAGTGVGSQLVENVAEKEMGLDVSPTEGLLEQAVVMGLLPVVAHAKDLYRQARSVAKSDPAKAKALQQSADDVAGAELRKVDTTPSRETSLTPDQQAKESAKAKVREFVMGSALQTPKGATAPRAEPTAAPETVSPEEAKAAKERMSREATGIAGIEKEPAAVVPSTEPEAERGINVLDEIKQSGARTVADIQRLFPQAQLSREAARKLRDQAWGKPEAQAPKAKPAETPPETPEDLTAQMESETGMNAPDESNVTVPVTKESSTGSAPNREPVAPTGPVEPQGKEQSNALVTEAAQPVQPVREQPVSGKAEVPKQSGLAPNDEGGGEASQPETPAQPTVDPPTITVDGPAGDWSYETLKALSVAQRGKLAGDLRRYTKDARLTDKAGLLELGPKKIAEVVKDLGERKIKESQAKAIKPEQPSGSVTETVTYETKAGPIAEFSPGASTNSKEQALGQYARDRILKSPSFEKLLAAGKSFQKSLGRSNGDVYEKNMRDQPWELLSEHAGVMNAKSARSKALKSLADAVIRESGLPMDKPGTYRGQDYRIDWDRFRETVNSEGANPESTSKPETPQKAADKVESEVLKSSQTTKDAKQSKATLVSELESELSKAKPELDVVGEALRAKGIKPEINAEKFQKQKDDAQKAGMLPTVTIDIPNDGSFTILKTKEALEEMLARAKRIATTPGIKKGKAPENGGRFDYKDEANKLATAQGSAWKAAATIRKQVEAMGDSVSEEDRAHYEKMVDALLAEGRNRRSALLAQKTQYERSIETKEGQLEKATSSKSKSVLSEELANLKKGQAANEAKVEADTKSLQGENFTREAYGPKETPAEKPPEPPVEAKPEVAAPAPAQKYRIGNNPSTYSLIERLPQSEAEKANGEQPVRVKNDRTGVEETVLEQDLKPVNERTPEQKASAKESKRDLDAELREAKMDPSVFPDESSKREALRRAKAKGQYAAPSGEGSTVESAKAEVEKAFGNVSDRISFEDEADNPYAARIDDRNRIVVNVARTAPGTVERVLLEEGLHGVWNEPEMARAWQSFKNAVTDYDIAAERSKRADLDTDRETLKEEAAISKLLNRPDSSVARRLWDMIISALDRLFGVKPQGREQLIEAARDFLTGETVSPEHFESIEHDAVPVGFIDPSQKYLNPEVVEQYRKDMRNGTPLEPIHAVIDHKTGRLSVMDGHHRLEAAKKEGLTHVPVVELALPYEKLYENREGFRSVGDSGHAGRFERRQRPALGESAGASTGKEVRERPYPLATRPIRGDKSATGRPYTIDKFPSAEAYGRWVVGGRRVLPSGRPLVGGEGERFASPTTSHLTPPPEESKVRKVMDAAGDGLRKLRSTIAHSWVTGDIRRAITSSRDAGDTAASLFGRKMANEVRQPMMREYGKANQQRAEDALTFAVEAKGDKSALSEMRDKILNSEKASPRTKRLAVGAIDFAIEKWDALQKHAATYKAITDYQVLQENAKGIDTLIREGYVMHEQDVEFEPSIMTSRSGTGDATGFRKVREHDTYADSIAAGIDPKSLNAVDLLQARVRRGQQLINKRAWVDGLKTFTDPISHSPIATDPSIITRADGSKYPQAPDGYTLEMIQRQPIAIHKGYEGIISALTDPSAFSRSLGAQSLMKWAGAGKSISLMFDTFHLGRVAFWDSLIKATGIKTFRMPFPSYRKGLTLADYTTDQIRTMAAHGEIPADWVNGLEQEHARLGHLVKGGYNIGRISDSLYQDFIHNLPFVGKVNRWVFEHFQRGAMAETGLLEFERLKSARPDMTDADVGRQVARDLNTRFGNLGRQGVFKSRTFQDLARFLVLAPQWNEGLIRSELGAGKQAAQMVADLARGKSLYSGVLLRSVGGMALAQFTANQIINYITRGHPTWENPEEGLGAKLSAWIPDKLGSGSGFFLHPLGLAAETTHLLMRKFEQTGDFHSSLMNYLRSRSSTAMRPMMTFITNQDFLGRNLKPGTVWGQMALDAVPRPIGGQAYALGAKQVATGKESESFAGQFEKQILSSVGIKTEGAPGPASRISSLAREFSRQRGIVPSAEFYSGDYQPLTSAVALGNEDAAKDAMTELLKRKTPEQVRKYMATWTGHPFTGQKGRESQFRATLTPEQREQYSKAIEQRRKIAQEVFRMLREKQQQVRLRPAA